jgi:hypothetical protein
MHTYRTWSQCHNTFFPECDRKSGSSRLALTEMPVYPINYVVRVCFCENDYTAATKASYTCAADGLSL